MRVLCLALLLNVAALPAWANARMTVLMDVLQVSEAVEILREEGFAYAQVLEADMLDGQGGPFWQAQVGQIYDTNAITETLRQAFEAHLSADQVEASIAFFASDLGGRVITLETAGRRAMADPDVEQAAKDYFHATAGQGDPRLELVEEFIELNDLLERNVSGAMSSNFQFYKGLSDGKLIPRSEDELLEEVWAQQDDIRADTQSWLTGFLLMAYHPLPLEDLETYVDYAQTPQGQALNAALFAGFEAVYRDVSYALGRAVALNAEGDEI